MSPRKRGSAWRAVAALACLLALSAGARPASAQSVAEAEALFREGRVLMEAGRREEACEKFEGSQRLDPSSGTLLNLAQCHFELGRTATAWAEFLAASRLALAQRQPERAEVARQRAAELEPNLGRLVIKVGEPVAGLVVTRNGEPINASLFGVAVPLDPGEYKITATAPHRGVFEETVVVRDDGQTVDVAVPRLTRTAILPSPISVVPGPTKRPVRLPSEVPQPIQEKRKLSVPFGAWALGGVAVAGATAGGVFGGLSLKSYRSAEGLCPTHVNCSPPAMEERNRADQRANIANVAFGVAVASAVATAIVILSSL